MAFKIESNLLDACALAILNRGDTYGYEITQEMKKATDVSESTLYPVLRRLQQNKLCFTYDQPYQGRNRRYYSITPAGQMKLNEYREMWTEYRNAIESLLLSEPNINENESGDSNEVLPMASEDKSNRSEVSPAAVNAENGSCGDETVDITESMKAELMTSERGEDDD